MMHVYAAHDEIGQGDIAFYFGCVQITPKEILCLNRRNFVVHASDLPEGKGFSPLTWKILEGENSIPVCLFEAVEELDAGPIIYKEYINFNGDELLSEMRVKMGGMHIELGLRFLAEKYPLYGEPQKGMSTVYKRRSPKDSQIDPHKSIAEQFNLFRVVDNYAYPAFFELHGYRYKLRIEKIDEE